MICTFNSMYPTNPLWQVLPVFIIFAFEALVIVIEALFMARMVNLEHGLSEREKEAIRKDMIETVVWANITTFLIGAICQLVLATFLRTVFP